MSIQSSYETYLLQLEQLYKPKGVQISEQNAGRVFPHLHDEQISEIFRQVQGREMYIALPPTFQTQDVYQAVICKNNDEKVCANAVYNWKKKPTQSFTEEALKYAKANWSEQLDSNLRINKIVQFCFDGYNTGNGKELYSLHQSVFKITSTNAKGEQNHSLSNKLWFVEHIFHDWETFRLCSRCGYIPKEKTYVSQDVVEFAQSIDANMLSKWPYKCDPQKLSDLVNWGGCLYNSTETSQPLKIVCGKSSQSSLSSSEQMVEMLLQSHLNATFGREVALKKLLKKS